MQDGKIKVVHLIDSLGTGGAERLLHTNLQHLDGTLFDHEVVTVFAQPDFWMEPIRDLGIALSTLDLTSRRRLFSAIRRFVGMMRESKPDIIHVHLWTASLVGRVAGRMLKIPVISSVHSLDHEPEAFRGVPAGLQLKLFGIRALDKLTAKWADQEFIAVSRRVKNSVRRRLRVPDERIEVIYNPIQRSETHGVSGKVDIRGEIGSPADAQVLLMVGRVSREKGIIDAIEAVQRLRPKKDNVHLAVIGAASEPVYLQQVERAAISYGVEGNVHLLGERSNIFEYLADCDVFLFPSRFEGLGIALAEAMAAGCACVASDIAPINEFMRDGETGLLVPPHDPAAIAAAINKLLDDEDLRRRLAENARRKALEMFDPVVAAKKLESLYLKTVPN